MARIKFADEKVDKGVQQVTQTRKKETMTTVTTGEVKSNQIKENQFVFTTIKKVRLAQVSQQLMSQEFILKIVRVTPSCLLERK